MQYSLWFSGADLRHKSTIESGDHHDWFTKKLQCKSGIWYLLILLVI